MVAVTTELCKELVDRFEPAPEARANNCMTIDGEKQQVEHVREG
jgi:hypothetical protein